MIKKVTIVIILLFALFAIPSIGDAREHDTFSVDLMWSSSTLVPNDYEGKSLAIRGSTIDVVALSDHPNRKNLEYNWFLDGDFIGFASGKGKNGYSLRVTNWPSFSHTIKVIVVDPTTIESQSSIVSIIILEPEIDILHPDPVFRGEPVFIRAVPYFFTEINLDYNWSFNFQHADGSSSNPSTLILEIGGSYTLPDGKLDLIVKNPKNPFEQTRKRVIINIE